MSLIKLKNIFTCYSFFYNSIGDLAKRTKIVMAWPGVTVRTFPAELLLRLRKIWISLLFGFYWTGLECERTCLQRIWKDRSGSAVITFLRDETHAVDSTVRAAMMIWYFSIDYAWRMRSWAIDISWVHRFFINAIRRLDVASHRNTEHALKGLTFNVIYKAWIR